MKTALWLSASVAALLSAHPAQAQTAAAPQGPAVDTSHDVVVTATRRSERLQDVPISVTAVRGTTLQQRGITSPEELARLTPTLTTQSAAANQQGTNFSIRGVGTAAFQRTIESSVATVIDDVTLMRPEMGILNFTDVDQVEVLNGPQGMLFGKNASAGLVSVRTANPVMGQTSGRFGTEYARLNTSNNTSLFRAYGVVNVPVSDNLAARFNLTYQYNTPIYRNLAANPDFEGQLREIIGAGKLLWKPTDKLTILIAGDYSDLKGLGPGVFSFRSVAASSPDNIFLGAVGITPSEDNTFSGYDKSTFANTQIGGGQVKVDYDLGGGTMLTNIAAYRTFRIRTDFDPDYSPADLVQIYSEPRGFHQFSDELRIASPTGGKFDYQVGLYFLSGRLYQLKIAGASLGSAPPPGFLYTLGGIAYQQQDLRSYAAFGQGTYHLTDSLRAIVGARLTYDEVTMRYSATANNSAIALIPVSAEQVATARNTNVSWRGILQYDVNRDVMFYATAAQGYKGPGFSEFSVRAVRPEISTHFEIGAKTQFFDRRLTLNVSAYHTGFKDFQAQSADFNTLTILVNNAGKLVTKGFDVQLSGQLARGLTLSGGLAYTDARFSSFKGDLCYPGQTTCVGGFSDSSGNRLPNAPEWKGVGSIRYEWAFTPGLNGNAQIGFSSQSSVEYFSDGDPHGHIGGFTTVDLNFGLAGRKDVWQLNLFCRNCTDHRYAGSVGNHPLFTADYLQNYSYNAFRSLGAALEFKF